MDGANKLTGFVMFFNDSGALAVKCFLPRARARMVIAVPSHTIPIVSCEPVRFPTWPNLVVPESGKIRDHSAPPPLPANREILNFRSHNSATLGNHYNNKKKLIFGKFISVDAKNCENRTKKHNTTTCRNVPTKEHKNAQYFSKRNNNNNT